MVLFLADQISPLSNNMKTTEFISCKYFNREKPLSFDKLILWVKKQMFYMPSTETRKNVGL